MTRAVLAIWLVVVWTALWGRISVANVLSGIVVAALLLTVFPTGKRLRPQYVLRPVAVGRLVAYFLRKLIESNVALTRTILSHDDQIRAGIISVPMNCESDELLTVVANLTALTPGTMAIEVERDPPRFYVHVLILDDIDSARAQILELERLVIEAFGSPGAVARVRTRASIGNTTGDPE